MVLCLLGSSNLDYHPAIDSEGETLLNHFPIQTLILLRLLVIGRRTLLNLEYFTSPLHVLLQYLRLS